MSFAGIIRKSTPFMFIASGDSVKITNNKPRNINRRNFRKLMPQGTLRMKTSQIINNRNNPISSRTWRDDNMESTTGDG